ncbi:MAG: hypothetical protein ACR2J8_13505, partial [Thermomicrobiales bacterium]
CPSVDCPEDVASICNLLAISTGWNDPARMLPDPGGESLEHPALRAALDRQPWAEPEEIGAWRALASDDPHLLLTWALARRRAGDDNAAREAARRALELQPGLFAAREALATERRPDVPARPVAVIPVMTGDELALFDSAAREARCIIEFGSGAGAVRLAEMGRSRVISIGGAREWAEAVRQLPAVAEVIAAGRMAVHHVDIGPADDQGFPRDGSRREYWPDYWREPWRHVEPEDVDLVIVDGRFRVACALQALLAGGDRLTLLFRDAWTRPHYQAILRHVACMAETDRSGFFVRSATFDREAAERDLASFTYNAR